LHFVRGEILAPDQFRAVAVRCLLQRTTTPPPPTHSTEQCWCSGVCRGCRCHANGPTPATRIGALGHVDVAVAVAISRDSAADHPGVVVLFIHCRPQARGRGKGPGVPRRKAFGVLLAAAAWLVLCILVTAVALCGGEEMIPCILCCVGCSNGPTTKDVSVGCVPATAQGYSLQHSTALLYTVLFVK
jgi:hypothetical protein